MEHGSMSRERRVTREDAEDLMSQIRRATEAGVEEATINVFGADLTFSKQSDGGFTFQAPDGTTSARFHQGSSSRPAEYPEYIPFIPNEPVTVSAAANTVSLMWFAPADPEALFRDLNQSTGSEGWALKDEAEFAQVPVRQTEYEANGLSRAILISGPMVSLIQKRLLGMAPSA
jgi:hypothetical protein